MANPRTTNSPAKKRTPKKTDAVEDPRDPLWSALETAESLHARVVGLLAERTRLLEERDLALQREEALRKAMKVQLADWDAMNDMPAGAVDAAEFDTHLQVVRHLVDVD